MPARIHPIINRRNFLRTTIAGALSCMGYGFGIEPSLLTYTRRSIICPKLPSALHGLKILHLTDFHFRPGTDDSLLQQLIEFTHQETPDLIALTGDFIDHDPATLPPLLDLLRQLRSNYGSFAVLGNHDGWNMPRPRVKNAFETVGIPLLINENLTLQINQQSLTIAGSDFVWGGSPSPAQMFHGIDPSEPVIALVHEPDYFDTIIQYFPILLQLSGHTHGGQCRVPIVDLVPIKVNYGKKYIYGQFRHQSQHLFVSRGLGTSNLRIRFAAPPEAAILTLLTPS